MGPFEPLLFSALAYAFLEQQSIWTDETSQMSGLTLGPLHVVEWLLGKDYQLHVPFDRAPPFKLLDGATWRTLWPIHKIDENDGPLLLRYRAPCHIPHGFRNNLEKSGHRFWSAFCHLLESHRPCRRNPLLPALFCSGGTLALYFFSQLLVSESRSSLIGFSLSCLAAITPISLAFSSLLLSGASSFYGKDP